MNQNKDARFPILPCVDIEGTSSIVNSQSDLDIVDEVRNHAINRSKYLQAKSGNASSPIPWSQISMAFPNTVGKFFSLDLEESETRSTVGIISGTRRGSHHAEDLLNEYFFAIFSQNTIRTIEYFIDIFRQECSIAIDGDIQIRISSRPKKLEHAPQWDVIYNGLPFGVAKRNKSPFSHSLQFELPSETDLTIPLKFGSTNKEVLVILLDLLTLRFLRHCKPRENRCYVIDQRASQILSVEEQAIFFATSLFFICSPFQFILGGST